MRWAAVPDGAPRRHVAWELLRGLAPDARLSNPCAECGGPHGAVRMHGTDAVASLSYAGNFAVVVVARAAALGVDAEVDGEPGLDRVLRPGASLREWVRVEAVLKADGRGLRVDPSLVGIRPSSAGAIARVADRAAEYVVRDVDGPPGVLVSIALGR